jgi:membrane protease YdiL (CAAX protease family)
MPEFGDANFPAPVSPPPLRTWDFVGTTFVVLIAYGVFVVVGGLTTVIMLVAHDVPVTSSHARALAAQGDWYGVALIVACPFTLAVLWIAIRIVRAPFVEYLALHWPSRGELVRALAIMFAVLLAESAVGYLASLGSPALGEVNERFAVGTYKTAEDDGGLFTYLVATCIVGPIMEELIVRGFLFRGWSQSFLGPIGAIVLTSAVWALNHTQYDWLGVLDVFVMGLALCYFRYRSGSTWLTVMVHSAINLAINAEIKMMLAFA